MCDVRVRGRVCFGTRPRPGGEEEPSCDTKLSQHIIYGRTLDETAVEHVLTQPAHSLMALLMGPGTWLGRPVRAWFSPPG